MASNVDQKRNDERRWEDLNRDLLISIFAKVGVADLISGVPFACSSWRDAARDPHCWSILDFNDWDSIAHHLDCHRQESIDFVDLLDFCINRGGDVVHSVIFPDFADEIDLFYVSERCPLLHHFSLVNTDIPESEFCRAVSKLSNLKGMAVHENLMCREALLRIDGCCEYLSELKVFAETVDQKMAAVICDCLPHLCKLEIPNCKISQNAILTLLDRLKELEYLDISGYDDNSGITQAVLDKASRLKVFRWE